MKKPSRPKQPKPSYTVTNAHAIKLALSTYLLLAKKGQEKKVPAVVRRTLLKWVEENLDILKQETS
jgi:hypothetical protein